MDTVIDYLVISAVTRNDLNTTIQRMLREGWQPVGGHVAHSSPGYPDEYQQTMVVYETPIS